MREGDMVEALTRSGVETGTVLHAHLMEGTPGDAATTFWQQLHRLLRRRGLGSLTHRRLHAGVGLIQISGSPESGEDPAEETGCPFTTGILMGILSAAAGREVDLRPIGAARDPSSGSPHDCRWVFGSTAALDQLNALLRSEQSLEDAVAHL